MPVTGQGKEERQPEDGAYVVDMKGHSAAPNKHKKYIRRKVSIWKQYDSVGDKISVCKYREEFLRKAENCDYLGCQTLLGKGANVNVKDKETKLTALHIAAKHGWLDILVLLLSKDADCNAQDREGQSPLHLAVTKDRTDCCQKLIECSNLKINIQNRSGDTPLHHAAKEGRENICMILLSQESVKVNTRNEKLRTPLHLAAMEGHFKVIEILVNKGADMTIRDRNSYMPLHFTAEKGFYKSCEVLMSNTSNADREEQVKACLHDSKTPLMLAAKGGHHKCCAKLKNMNVNAVDKDGNTALYFAAVGGHESTLLELLNMGVKPDTQNTEGSAPILEAASKKKDGCLRVLVKNGAHIHVVDNQNKNVFHYAAEKNAVECLKYLLSISELSPFLNRKDNDNCTPLHVAFKHEAEECAYILLMNKASPVEQHRGGMTPLHLAADRGYTRICRLLLEKDEVNASQGNEIKETPLHLAARRGSADICHLLLCKGARLLATNELGQTALHVASQNGHANVLIFFIKKGVCQQSRDDAGNTALHLAASVGSLECCQVLSSSAKSLFCNVDQNGDLALDRAFKKKHDIVFKFLLMNLPYDEHKGEWMIHLHRYMHTALSEGRLIAVEAIIDSSWWEAGFTGENGHHCQNFRLLIERHPSLALKVQDKSVLSDSQVKYDLRLLEDNYYIPAATSTTAMSPFEGRNWQVSKNAHQFIKDGLEWKNMHPLSLMVSHRRHQLLQHPLIKAWLLHKWRSYIRIIFFTIFILELFFVICFTFYMGGVYTWSGIARQCNLTREGFCNQSDSLLQANKLDLVPKPPNTATENSTDSSSVTTSPQFVGCIGAPPTNHEVFWILLFLTAITLLVECNYIYRMRNLENVVQILRVIFIIISLVPGSCELHYHILNDVQWQFGILALLVGWLHFISILNQLPMFSLFTPITCSFLKGFLGVLFYITMLIFVFAFTFHLLLRDHTGFLTVPQSIVKTIVWILGDLAYNETFLNEDHRLVYPVMVNILFILFVTVISGFIINLVITQPSGKLNHLRDKAEFQRAARQCKLFLNLDVCFPFFHKYRTRGKLIYEPCAFSKRILRLNTIKKEAEPPSSQELELSEDEEVSPSLTLPKEHRDEIWDLQQQLNIMTKSLSEIEQSLLELKNNTVLNDRSELGTSTSLHCLNLHT